MQKREAKFCTALGKWWINEGHKLLPVKNYHVEAKVSVGNKPFNYRSGIKSHQTPTLIAFNTKPMAWKISDAAMTTQLCDSIFSHPKTTHGIFAIMWSRPKNKKFYLIDPVTIQGKIDDGKKSLTEDEASRLALIIGELK